MINLLIDSLSSNGCAARNGYRITVNGTTNGYRKT